MWKGRAVVASAVGGIVDQIIDGEHGLLLEDPSDLVGFGAYVQRLLENRPFAESLGGNAHRRVRAAFLGDRHLQPWGPLLAELENPRSLSTKRVTVSVGNGSNPMGTGR